MTHGPDAQITEALIQRVTLSAALLSIALIFIKGAAVDYGAYGGAIGTGALLIAIGLFYRHSGRDDRLGSTLICAGWFVLFTLSLSLFNYLLMPHWAPTFDVTLATIDAALFGYHWPDFVERSAGFPLLNEAMRVAYLSTLPQIAVLLVILGLSGRMQEMYSLIRTLTIAGTAVVVFWGFLPSMGPSVLYDIAPDILAHARPVVGPDYGRAIAALFKDGANVLSPDEIRGLVAFPSFHIVLALAATYFARTVVWIFPVYLTINLFVLPGVLAHGGHHVVDIPAGFALFAVAAYLSHRAVLSPARNAGMVQEGEGQRA
ncbi:phosphatase PAP2 family protein [Mesorhizobium sp. CAU 1732]|uniref:phosphatase PAP2 family protein n=1 Tax=Mesorhizobium sp. CAU 1732 TaxID=3140358 RepID=UPI0032606C18